jgi:hypothetical protein
MQDSKDVAMTGAHTPPAHEIRLEQEEVQPEEGETEMVEKVHAAPSLYKFGHDGSKTGSGDAMTGVKSSDKEVDLIDFS